MKKIIRAEKDISKSISIQKKNWLFLNFLLGFDELKKG